MRRPPAFHSFASAVIAALALFLACAAKADDHPLRGVALVIGQSDYAGLPKLANPKNDARAIDDLLDGLGFDVTRVLDGTDDKLKQKIDRFVEDAADADVAVVYYSGHGIEAGGEDYLVPVDADLSTPQRAGETLLPVSDLLEQLARSVPVTIVLLDACRTGAFPDGTMIQPPGASAPVLAEPTGLGIIRGPAPVAKAAAPAAGYGTVIGFAASPGEPALDGAPGDENSPYAAALLKHFGAGGYSFGDVMTMVSEEVYLKTGARQLPWVNSSLRRVLSFGQVADPADPDQAAIRSARRQLLLNISTTPPETQKYVESLAGEEKVPLDALYGMLDALGVKAGSDGGNLTQQLQKGAERLKELVSEAPAAVSSDAELLRLSKLADEAQAEGAIALALKYRDQASARADTLLESKQAEAARLKQDMVDIAATYAANAATASLNFDHLHAAELYGKAFEAVKDWDKGLAVTYKISQGDALSDRGYYVGDNDALRQAFATYEAALPLAPRDADPGNWGRLEDRMGQARALLGTRLGDVTMMQSAVDLFRTALLVETREALPDRWAAVQNNLGNVFNRIGAQTGSVDLLQQSVTAFDQALEVYTRDSNPVRWATVTSNRGNSEVDLAHAIYAATADIQTRAIQAGNKDVEHIPEVASAIAKAVAILSDTVTSLQAAVDARPRADNPLDWALIENGIGSALSQRAELTDSPEDLKAAADAYRAVLEVHDPQRTPVQWSVAAGNLATTLSYYARMTHEPAPLVEGTGLLERAIALTPQAEAPGDWAEFETKLGNNWSDRSGYDNDPASAEKAVTAYRAAQQVLTPDADLASWANIELYILSTLLKPTAEEGNLDRVKRARDVATEAYQLLTARGSTDADMFANVLPTLNQYIDMISGDQTSASEPEPSNP